MGSMLILKKEKGINELIPVGDKAEIARVLTMDGLSVLNIENQLLIDVALTKESEIESDMEVDLSNVNLFLATTDGHSVGLHTLMSDVVYVIVRINSDEESVIDAIVSSRILYLDEEPSRDEDGEIILSHNYDVRISKRRGVLLDCTINK